MNLMTKFQCFLNISATHLGELCDPLSGRDPQFGKRWSTWSKCPTLALRGIKQRFQKKDVDDDDDTLSVYFQ